MTIIPNETTVWVVQGSPFVTTAPARPAAPPRKQPQRGKDAQNAPSLVRNARRLGGKRGWIDGPVADAAHALPVRQLCAGGGSRAVLRSVDVRRARGDAATVRAHGRSELRPDAGGIWLRPSEL